MFETLKQKAKQLKKQILVVYLVYTHASVPWYKRLFLLAILLYALSPIDLIPDFIPVLGLLDDLILIPLGIVLAMKMIPRSIWDECRLKADEGIVVNQKFGRYGAVIIVALWLLMASLVVVYLVNH